MFDCVKNQTFHFVFICSTINMGQSKGLPGLLIKYKFLIFVILLLVLLYQYRHLKPDWIVINNERLEESEFVERNFETLEQDDIRFIRYVRNRYLVPPSKQPYNWKNPG